MSAMAARRMDNNAVGGRAIGTRESLRRNDALPAPLRAVLNAAPFRMHPINGEEKLALFRRDPRAARDALIQDVARKCVAETILAYGADHPCVARMQAIAEGRRA